MNKVIHRNFFARQKTIRIIAPLFILFFSFFIYSNTYADVSYSITYDSSVVTDMPTDIDSESMVENVPIASSRPALANRVFLGWCTTTPVTVGSVDTCSNGTVYQPNSNLAIDQTGSNNDYHLYAMWGNANNALLDTGSNVNTKIKTLAAGTSKSYSESTSDIKAVRMADSLPSGFIPSADNTVSATSSESPIYIFYDNTNNAGIMYFYTEGDHIFMNQDSSSILRGNTALTDISALASWDTSAVTNLAETFMQDSSLVNLTPLTNWNTSNVRSLDGTFRETAITNTNALASWNTSQVINMRTLFYNDTSLSDISALADWDTSNVQNIGAIFRENSSLTSLSGLAKWDTSNVVTMTQAFVLMSSLSDISGLAKWDTSKVQDISWLFYLDTLIQDYSPLANWNVGNVTTMYATFQETSLTNLNFLSKWNTSSLEDLRQTFYNIPTLTSISGMANWDVSKVTNMMNLFNADTSISDATSINDWDVRAVTATAGSSSSSNNNFYHMFYNCPTRPTFTKRAGTWSNGTFVPSP